jgi:hypothetical protein
MTTQELEIDRQVLDGMTEKIKRMYRDCGSIYVCISWHYTPDVAYKHPPGVFGAKCNCGRTRLQYMYSKDGQFYKKYTK